MFKSKEISDVYVKEWHMTFKTQEIKALDMIKKIKKERELAPAPLPQSGNGDLVSNNIWEKQLNGIP
jgi:hypothetical protein